MKFPNSRSVSPSACLCMSLSTLTVSALHSVRFDYAASLVTKPNFLLGMAQRNVSCCRCRPNGVFVFPFRFYLVFFTFSFFCKEKKWKMRVDVSYRCVTWRSAGEPHFSKRITLWTRALICCVRVCNVSKLLHEIESHFICVSVWGETKGEAQCLYLCVRE